MQLRRSLPVALVLAAGLGITSVAHSFQPADTTPTDSKVTEKPQPSERRGAGGQPAQPGIGTSMKLMGRSLRQLRSQIDQPAARAENLKLINDMQRGCIAAKSAPFPNDVKKGEPKPGDLPSAPAAQQDQAAHAAEAETYRKHLARALRLLLDIEDAVADGKPDVAKAKTDDLIKLRDAAHKELEVKED